MNGIFQIEQLSAETGEDSVLLTTSVIDGPVSLTGSKSGKAFLQQHADVQAEFSEFCGKCE